MCSVDINKNCDCGGLNDVTIREGHKLQRSERASKLRYKYIS